MTKETIRVILVGLRNSVFIPVISWFLFLVIIPSLLILIVFPLLEALIGINIDFSQVFAVYFSFILNITLTLFLLIRWKKEIITGIKKSKLMFILPSFLFSQLYLGSEGFYSIYKWISSEYSVNHWYYLAYLSPFYPFSLGGRAYLEGSLKIPDGYITPVLFGDHMGWTRIVSIDTFIFLVVISIVHGLLLTTFLGRIRKKYNN